MRLWSLQLYWVRESISVNPSYRVSNAWLPPRLLCRQTIHDLYSSRPNNSALSLHVWWRQTNPPFAPFILLIQFHYIFFHFFQSSKPFHSIPIFSTIFFNFPNPYAISLNLNHLYHLEICKVKLFFKPFFKPFSNHLNGQKWPKWFFQTHGHIGPSNACFAERRQWMMYSLSFHACFHFFFSFFFCHRFPL